MGVLLNLREPVLTMSDPQELCGKQNDRTKVCLEIKCKLQEDTALTSNASYANIEHKSYSFKKTSVDLCHVPGAGLREGYVKRNKMWSFSRN